MSEVVLFKGQMAPSGVFIRVLTVAGGGVRVVHWDFPCGISLAKAASCRNLVSDAKRHFAIVRGWLLYRIQRNQWFGELSFT